MIGELRIHRVWCQIDLARPHNCAAIDKDLLEKPHVRQGGEDTREFLSPQLHAPCSSVLEADKQAEVWFGLYFNYIPIHDTRIIAQENQE